MLVNYGSWILLYKILVVQGCVKWISSIGLVKIVQISAIVALYMYIDICSDSWTEMSPIVWPWWSMWKLQRILNVNKSLSIELLVVHYLYQWISWYCCFLCFFPTSNWVVQLRENAHNWGTLSPSFSSALRNLWSSKYWFAWGIINGLEETGHDILAINVIDFS